MQDVEKLKTERVVRCCYKNVRKRDVLPPLQQDEISPPSLDERGDTYYYIKC